MVKLQNMEIEKVVNPPLNKESNLPLMAKLLRAKFDNRSPEEQLRFFENVVKQSVELKVYKEELNHLKNGGASL